MKLSIKVTGKWRAGICKCSNCEYEFTSVRQSCRRDENIICPECRTVGSVVSQEPPWVGQIEMVVE